MSRALGSSPASSCHSRRPRGVDSETTRGVVSAALEDETPRAPAPTDGDETSADETSADETDEALADEAPRNEALDEELAEAPVSYTPKLTTQRARSAAASARAKGSARAPVGGMCVIGKCRV